MRRNHPAGKYLEMNDDQYNRYQESHRRKVAAQIEKDRLAAERSKKLMAKINGK